MVFGHQRRRQMDQECRILAALGLARGPLPRVTLTWLMRCHDCLAASLRLPFEARCPEVNCTSRIWGEITSRFNATGSPGGSLRSLLRGCPPSRRPPLLSDGVAVAEERRTESAGGASNVATSVRLHRTRKRVPGRWHQVWELPAIKPHVKEYRQSCLRKPRKDCGRHHCISRKLMKTGAIQPRCTEIGLFCNGPTKLV